MSISDPAGLCAVLTVVLLAFGYTLAGLGRRSLHTSLFMLAACPAFARLVMVGPSFAAVLFGCAGLLAALLIYRPHGEAAVKLALCAFLVGTSLPHFAPPLAELLSRSPIAPSEAWDWILPYASTAILIALAVFLGAGLLPGRAGAALAVFGALLAWPFHDPLSTLPFALAAVLPSVLLLVLYFAPDKRPFGEETAT